MVQRTINPYYDTDKEPEDNESRRYKASFKGDLCDFCSHPISSAQHLVFKGDRLWKVFCSHKCYLDILTEQKGK